MRTKILIIIIIIAALFRFIDLGNNPPSLNWDEIAIGWNAYSILQTGKDEFGQYLPLIFRSFDDYKSPLYIYFTVISIFLFGQNEFAIRFTSALLGTVTVLVFYFFTKCLLKTNVINEEWNNRIANVSLFSTFVLAISPWHVHFSRVAFEANIALFWEILGATLLLKWTDNKKFITLTLSAVSFIAALYSYANARVIVILILMGITFYYYKSFVNSIMQIVLAGAIGLVFCVPLIIQMYQGVGLARYNATTILGNNVEVESFNRNDKLAKEDFDLGDGWLSSKVHNFRIPMAREILKNYLSHFNYSFLYKQADLPRHQIPGFGLLYLWQLPLIVIGAVFILKHRYQLNAFLLTWFFIIAPIPAAVTWQVPHSIRSLLLLPAFCTLTGFGLWVVLKFIQQQDLKSYAQPELSSFNEKVISVIRWAWPKVTFIIIFCLIFVSVASMAVSYKYHLPVEFSANWLYGRKQMVEYVHNQLGGSDQVIVALSLDWSYLWFLWYGNYSPEWYLKNGGTVSGGFEETQNRVGKIKFHNFNYAKQKNIPNLLMVGSPSDFPGNIVPNFKILDLSGNPIIFIVKT